eukprot:7840366-Pyramimonas_sp.AAC.1
MMDQSDTGSVGIFSDVCGSRDTRQANERLRNSAEGEEKGTPIGVVNRAQGPRLAAGRSSLRASR